MGGKESTRLFTNVLDKVYVKPSLIKEFVMVCKYTNAELKAMKAKVPPSNDENRAKKISL